MKKRSVQAISPDLVHRVRDKYPGGSFEDALDQFIQSLEKEIEMLKAGKEAGSRLETSQESGITSKLESASPATESVTYDWSGLEFCPACNMEDRLCMKDYPQKRYPITPRGCEFCHQVAVLRDKLKGIDLEKERLRAERAEKKVEAEHEKLEAEKEKTRRRQMSYERGPPTVYFPDGEVWG